MEVVPIRVPKTNGPTGAVGLPFNRRNVEEWSRIDRLTGIMETAKIETDHWAARTNNAAHNYGKVVDSRERNSADGSLRERQRKQMEVFQTKVPGGSMQVIRTQTITTSSKKWSSSVDKSFDDLQLPVNSLDLSSQKTKGSVGRSGSIGGRRPPTRPRSLISQSSNSNAFEEDSSMFKQCQRLQDHSEIGSYKAFGNTGQKSLCFGTPKRDGSDAEGDRSGVADTNKISSISCERFTKNNLSRQKSCSNENVAVESTDESQLKRSSKVRRSLQCRRPIHSGLGCDPEDDYEMVQTKSLKERAAEIEKLLRHGNSNYTSQSPDIPSESYGKMKFLKTKESFVSAETLKEVRDRLKKSNLSDTDAKDDGIGTEKCDYDLTKANGHDRGLQIGCETDKKLNVNTGTGSLESRYSNRNSGNASRTSEWYRRRKSYGFEQVDEYEKFDKFNKRKTQIDSSTDSGICQSSETMGVPSWNKNADSIWTKMSLQSTMNSNKDPLANVVTVKVKKDQKDLYNNHSYDRRTNSVYLDGQSNAFLNRTEDGKTDNVGRTGLPKNCKDESYSSECVWNRKSPNPIPKTADNFKSSLRGNSKNPWISQLRGTKLVDRNWISDDIGHEEETVQKSSLNNSGVFVRDDAATESNGQKKGKKVEFCKTEVHFAAESGKFNIVETDGKPPPNDMFRRRRRSTAPATSAKDTNGLPQTKFGDPPLEKTLLTTPEKVESISEKIEAELKELSRIVIEALPQSDKPEGDRFQRKNSWLYDVAEEPVENGETEYKTQRTTIKNYGNSHLPCEPEFRRTKVRETNGVRSPLPEAAPIWQSTVVLRNKRFDNVRRDIEDKKMYASDGESELQIRIRNLRKTDPEQKLWTSSPYDNSFPRESQTKRRSLPDEYMMKNNSGSTYGNHNGNNNVSVSSDETPMLSVAERVKQVEKLKSNNYSTKINFRSGEMTVVQNGTSAIAEEPRDEGNHKAAMTSWAHQKIIRTPEETKKDNHQKDNKISRQAIHSCDDPKTSNPPVMRFSTHEDKPDNQKYQTTRILINFKTSAKGDTKKIEGTPSAKINNNNNNTSSGGKPTNTHGSWSSGMKTDLSQYLNELKSTSLLRETIRPDNPESPHREDIPKPSKPVHEIINQFDSLSSKFKEKRRKPIPAPYRPMKEYTHSDLEEELKNFTENLDRDFKNIYEEEIGSFQKSKSLRDSARKSDGTGKLDSWLRAVINKHSVNSNISTKSSSDEAPKKSPLGTSSRDNYDTDDSDLLADEEVRSYMSAGHGGSDSEGGYGSTGSRISFEDSIMRFKKLESQMKDNKEIRSNRGSISTSTIYPKPKVLDKSQDSNKNPTSKIASIALNYQEEKLFSEKVPTRTLKHPSAMNNNNTSSNELSTDAWDRTSNSSSAMSTKPRERVSYLNGLSLSEKYTKYLRRSSNSSTDTVSDCAIHKTPGTLLEGFKEYQKNKCESDGNGYKSKYPYRGYLVSSGQDETSECRKDEKSVNDKLSQSKYLKRCDHSESSRYRTKPVFDKPSSHKNLFDKYQIRDCQTSTKGIKERSQTDGEIEELKRAAEEIVTAVNGYTDDSSLVGSSEDDRPKRIIKKNKFGNLGTISEGKRVTKTEAKRTIATTTYGRPIGNNSSASSTESLNQKETYKPVKEQKSSSRHKHGESSKSSASKHSRLHQRATREAVIGQPSSSEDIPSCVEQVKRRVVRRQKTVTSTKPQVTSESKQNSSRHKPRSKVETSPNRTGNIENVKEPSGVVRTSRSNRTTEGEKTKSSSRRSATEKQSDIEAHRRRRSQRTATKEEPTPTQILKKKICGSKKREAFKTSQST